ncbi:MAG: BACON domain-containing protein [Gammaproteobacteria bacterium]|nr:BACON domain-containing protein [Gammaproteobacteria bacterium]
MPPSQDIVLTVNYPPPYVAGVAYPPGVTPAAWLGVTATGSSGQFIFRFAVNTTQLSPGTYTTTVGVGIGQSDGTIIAYETVAISYVVSSLGAATGALSFAYERGQPAPQKQLSLLGSGNWTASADSWLSLSANSGTLPATIMVGIDPANAAGLATGDYSGTITFTRTGSSETASVKVALKAYAGSHRLRVSNDGVAFATTPGRSNLSRTMSVTDNFGMTTSWSASADQSWLTVTSSGTTPGSLVLTANAAGLAADNVYTATVSIIYGDSTIQNIATINVGLWVGSATPMSPASVSGLFTQVVADPVRPYAYAHSAGTELAVYNVYTGALVRTINAVAGQAGHMAISSDGRRLFVVDDLNNKIVPIDLNDFSVGTPWPSGARASGMYLSYARSNDMGLIVTGYGNIFRTDGVKLTQTFGDSLSNYSEIPAASSDGTQLCHVNTGTSPYTVVCHSLFYGYSTGDAMLGLSKSLRSGGSDGRDIALNADGSLVYVAAGAPYAFLAYNTATMETAQTLAASSYPNTIEIAANGLVFGGIDTTGSNDVWVYDSSGVLSTMFSTSSLVSGQLALSGDSLRMITLERGPDITGLALRTIP